MKILWQELVKISRQLQGSENFFGYKSTVANQLYLFYCFSGKIYFTDKIHQQVKYLWYGIISGQIIFSFLIGYTYLRNGFVKNDLAMMLNVVNSFGTLHMTALGIPLISYFNSDCVERMISRVDNILSRKGVSDLHRKNVFDNAKNNFLVFLGLYTLFIMINLLICFLDVGLLFEKSNVENYLYYAYPVFLMHEYNSIGSFFIINGISTIVFVMRDLEAWVALSLISYWGTVWYDELIYLCDELNATMHNLDMQCRKHSFYLNHWDEAFEGILKHNMERFQEITSLINDLRGFVDAYGAVLIFCIYLYGVFFLYNSTLNNIPEVLMVKYATAFLASIVVVFLFYWIGQNFQNAVFDVRMAIYSTPWYRSVKVRKNAYIFLCQTESVKSFAIFKVYWLLLNKFSRYMHTLVSYTNVLRKITRK